MKFAKKMKLVELENDISNQYHQPDNLLLDENYTKPKILSKLDALMTQILQRKDITDNDKWLMYKQALHRYLHFANKPVPPNIERDDSNKHTNTLMDNYFSRDSIDMITQPSVREFFESARENPALPPSLSMSENELSLSPQVLRSGRERQRKLNVSSKYRQAKKRKRDEKADTTLIHENRRSSSLPKNGFKTRNFDIIIERWDS